jgi:hypothetical protein
LTLPLPCGDGTVAFSALMRASFSAPASPGVIRAKHLEQGGCSQPAHRKFLRAVEERTPVDASMHITIKQVQLLRKIGCFLSVH